MLQRIDREQQSFSNCGQRTTKKDNTAFTRAFLIKKKQSTIAITTSCPVSPLSDQHNILMVRNTPHDLYINASTIQMPQDKQGSYYFIVTQSPKIETEKIFWEMLYQNNVSTILMLCRFDTDDPYIRPQCIPYLSFKDKKTSGQITITMHKEELNYFYGTNRRQLSLQRNGIKKTLVHYQATKWQEFGDMYQQYLQVIQEKLLPLLIQNYQRQRKSNFKMVLHCPTGIGRSGMLLALLLIKYFDKSSYDSVAFLRQQRMMMVQSSDQWEQLLDIEQKWNAQKGIKKEQQSSS